MKRRFFSTALVSATAWLSTSAAWAQATVFKSGKDFLTLDRPVATEAGTGKVEVIEFFWYSCPHCNAFEPAFAQWVKNAPKDVVVRRIPVSFRDDFAPQQRLFFTLEAMAASVDQLPGVRFSAKPNRQGLRRRTRNSSSLWALLSHRNTGTQPLLWAPPPLRFAADPRVPRSSPLHPAGNPRWRRARGEMPVTARRCR